MIFQILIGIFLLGLVIFVHELGHFLAAQLCDVEVLTFSIGWGPVIFKKKIGKTEYRLSALPFGGYCGMKGQDAIREAIEKKSNTIEKEEGSFYSAHPFKRICIALSGPVANLLLAFLVFSIASTLSISYRTYSNKIVPVYLFENEPSPALQAGLKEGDIITKFDTENIYNFYDLQKIVAINPDKTSTIEYIRDGQQYTTNINVQLDKKTGTGKIGVYPFIPLTIDLIHPNFSHSLNSLLPQDKILKANGISVEHVFQFEKILENNPKSIMLEIERDGKIIETDVIVQYNDKNEALLGIQWESILVTKKGNSFLQSFVAGWRETFNTIKLTIKSIGILFKGVDLSEAVSGPVRITMMIGEVAVASFSGVLELLGIICVSLFLMNLLPIPILDGGIILTSTIELVRSKPLKPKTLYYIQFIGVLFIFSILIFALLGDIQFLRQ